jgi:hypothetical protein
MILRLRLHEGFGMVDEGLAAVALVRFLLDAEDELPPWTYK